MLAPGFAHVAMTALAVALPVPACDSGAREVEDDATPPAAGDALGGDEEHAMLVAMLEEKDHPVFDGTRDASESLPHQLARAGLRAALVALASVAVLVPASAAYGHASDVVPQAEWSAEGSRVVMDWWAAADDVAGIAVALDLLPEEAALAYRGIGDRYPSKEAVARFAASAELESYLLDNVRVSQDGRPCDAQVTVPDQVIAEGARFTFVCPQPVERVAVRITLLHDLDEHFRTYSIDGTLWSPVHTVQQPEHVWDATSAATAIDNDPGPAPSTGPALGLGLGLGLGLALAVGAAVLWRARSGSRRRAEG